MSEYKKEWRVPLLKTARVPAHIRERLNAKGAKLDNATLIELRKLLRLDEDGSADEMNWTKRKTR